MGSGQLEVEDVEIAGDPLGVTGPWDHDIAQLDAPPDQHLCGGATVLPGDGRDGGVVDQSADCQRAVGLGDDIVPRVHRPELGLIEQRVQLDLVDRGGDVGQVDGRLHMLLGEVAYPDGAGDAVPAGLDQAAEGVHVFTELRHRPMDQKQVDVVQPEPVQADSGGVLGGLESLVGVRDLGGDEQLRARDSGRRDGAADGGFVAVHRGGVDQPVADFQRRRYGALGFVLGQLGDAETEYRHRVFVVECNEGN